MIYTDLLAEDYRRIAGMSGLLYYAPVSYFSSIPAVVADPSTVDDAVVISEDFGFNAGRFWNRIRITIGTGSVIDDMVGNRKNKVFFTSMDFKLAGTKKENLAFAAMAKDDEFILLAVEPTQQVRVIGSQFMPAELFTPVKREADYTSYDGVICRAEAYAATPAPIYTGAIQIVSGPGDFNDDFSDDFYN